VAQVAELGRPIATEQVQPIEIIDAAELGRRLQLPKSWILENTRSRAADKIPHLRFGKYVRFSWGSRDLKQWLERRASGKDGKV
jgi:hypothetical protein